MNLPDPAAAKPKLIFGLGIVVATPGVLEFIPQSEIVAALNRHCKGDWGDLDQEDWEANDLALVEGTRILSTYFSKSCRKFWIITEADRSVTTVLLPSEY